MGTWADIAGEQRGAGYQARFERLAARGHNVHGEADFCAALVEAPARVLDAGCGTGRIAIRLAERGYRCVGVDVDAVMLAEARRAAPGLTWIEADLVEYSPGSDRFELVVAAGNVLPLLDRGTEATVVQRLAGALVAGGLLVAGFGLDPAHLPIAAAPFGLAEYDAWCAAAGLTLVDRFATWDGATFVAGGGYAVSVHHR